MRNPVLWSLLLVATPTLLARAQEPVNKPIPAPATGDRLPAPATVTAVQLPDGRIQVRWSTIPGATSYALVRSVPPTPAQPIAGTITDTLFVDSDVTAGRTYYYVISGLSDAATGMKKGTAPVTAIRGVGPVAVVSPPTNVSAVYEADRKTVRLFWQGPAEATYYFFESREVPSNSWVLIGQGTAGPASIFRFTEGARMQYRVIARDAVGTRSAPALSNELFIPLSTGSPVSGGASPSSGTVAVSMGALSLRVGSATSAASAVTGFSASRWVSLDEPIATVDASGTVTGRSAGRAHVLAIGRGGDGSVRVALVQVSVTP